MIYYLMDTERDTVKIGYTTPSNMKSRLSVLKSGNSSKLKLIGIHSGTRDKEKFVHTTLVEYKDHGEWFHLDPIVIEYIEEHNDFEYFFDVFEDKIKNGSLNQPVFQRFLEAFAFERGGANKLKLKVGTHSDNYKNLSEWTNYAMMLDDIESAAEDTYYLKKKKFIYGNLSLQIMHVTEADCSQWWLSHC